VSDWLTYADAAARFGISSEAVRQLALRHHWPRRKLNNDLTGKVQVLVPDDFEARPRTPVQRPNEQESDARPTTPTDMLLEALHRERERADVAEKQRDAAISRADAAYADRRATEARLTEQIERESQRADQAFGMIDGFRAERDREIARAERAEQALAGERTRLDALRDRMNAVESAARETQQTAEVHQDRLRAEVDSVRAELAEARRTEDERKGRGRWARLRAAWLGE
jgi:chromosome segregation ATPase